MENKKSSPTSHHFLGTSSLSAHVFLWVETPKGRFIGKGRVELMEKIIEHGSISKAAKAMKMTYKKAWDLISSMNGQSERLLVLAKAGGEKGGGAVVTEEGRLAISIFRGIQLRLAEFIRQENERLQKID